MSALHPSLANWDQPSAASSKLPSAKDRSDQAKKPRHRHSASQLAALNALYEKNEHPPLEDRTALAHRLGMYVPPPAYWLLSEPQLTAAVADRSGRQRRSTLGSKINAPRQRSGTKLPSSNASSRLYLP